MVQAQSYVNLLSGYGGYRLRHGPQTGVHQAGDIEPMVFSCWATVYDAGPT